MTCHEDEQIQRTVDVELTPDEVWTLLVDDDERAGWFGGPTTLDPVPGGAGTFTDPDGSRRRATVEDADAGRRISWTWWPESDEGLPSRVEVDLEPSIAGTRISVTETPLVPIARASLRSGRDVPGGVPLLALEVTCLLRAQGRVLA